MRDAEIGFERLWRTSKRVADSRMYKLLALDRSLAARVNPLNSDLVGDHTLTLSDLSYQVYRRVQVRKYPKTGTISLIISLKSY